jgi:hypothetical protein
MKSTQPLKTVFNPDSMELSFVPTPGAKYDAWLEDERGEIVITIINNVQQKMSKDDVFCLTNQPHKTLYRPGKYRLFLDILENGNGLNRPETIFSLTETQACNANYKLMSAEYRNVFEMAKRFSSMVNLPAETKATLARYEAATDKLQLDLASQIATIKANNGKYDGILLSARKNLGQVLSDMMLEFEGYMKLADGQLDNFLLEKQQQFEALRISLAEKPPVVPRQFTEAMQRMEKLREELREYTNNVERRLGTKAESVVVDGISYDLGKLRNEVTKLVNGMDGKADAGELKLLVQQLSKLGKKLNSFKTKLKSATTPAPVPVTPSPVPAPAPAPVPTPTLTQMGVPPLPSRLRVIGTKVRGLWAHANRRQVTTTAMIIIVTGIMMWFVMARYANHHASQIDAKTALKATAEGTGFNWQSPATRKIEYIGSY